MCYTFFLFFSDSSWESALHIQKNTMHTITLSFCCCCGCVHTNIILYVPLQLLLWNHIPINKIKTHGQRVKCRHTKYVQAETVQCSFEKKMFIYVFLDFSYSFFSHHLLFCNLLSRNLFERTYVYNLWRYAHVFIDDRNARIWFYLFWFFDPIFFSNEISVDHTILFSNRSDDTTHTKRT